MSLHFLDTELKIKCIHTWYLYSYFSKVKILQSIFKYDCNIFKMYCNKICIQKVPVVVIRPCSVKLFNYCSLLYNKSVLLKTKKIFINFGPYCILFSNFFQ